MKIRLILHHKWLIILWGYWLSQMNYYICKICLTLFHKWLKVKECGCINHDMSLIVSQGY